MEKYQFDHAAQVVPDIAETIAWYQANLKGAGVRVLYSDGSWGLIEVGGTRLAFFVKDQHPNHLAWSVSQEELERLASLHQKEIKPHRDGTRSFYLEAPGGNSVEIIAISDSSYEKMVRSQ